MSPVFTLPVTSLQIHQELSYANMRSSLPEDDAAVARGFAKCRNTVDRLLKQTRQKDIDWAAQFQCMRDEYETRMAEEKAVGERMLSQRQKELERWQERCDQLERGLKLTERP